MNFYVDGNLLAAVLSILAGVLILLRPRLLNYIVALYLIIVGVLMLLARF